MLQPFLKEEYFQALKQMNLDKAPEPDSFNPTFFHTFWDITGEDIFREGLIWLQQGTFPYGFNDTNICLIPKCNDPMTMRDLHQLPFVM